MKRPNISEWRAGLPEPLITRIEHAIDQFRADERYEEDHESLSETLRRLKRIEDHSRELINAIDGLTPVGKAAIHDAAMHRGDRIGRSDLRRIAEQIALLPRTASKAGECLLAMHSPMPDEEHGQGAGSAIGRDSDLRAIKAEHDRRDFHFAFRSPKDKFGVTLLRAYLRHQQGFDVTERGAARRLEEFLSQVWRDVCPDRQASWKRLLSARRAIAKLVASDLATEMVWRAVQLKRNASSPEFGRSPPEDTPSYAVPPDHPGGIDVNFESEGRSGPAGAEPEHAEQMAYPGARP
jgi:hypothetical protein